VPELSNARFRQTPPDLRLRDAAIGCVERISVLRRQLRSFTAATFAR
jgi:hypothetical protein